MEPTNGTQTQELTFDTSLLPATTRELTPTQMGWLAMEHQKRTTFEQLKNDELSIQGKVAQIKQIVVSGTVEQMTEQHTRLKSVLAETKAEWKTMEGRRKYFTGFITDNLVSPAMEFEKRALANLSMAETHEFNQRKVIDDTRTSQQYIINEKAAYKAHIENEIARIATTYRAELERFIVDCYKVALESNTLPGTISSLVNGCKQQLTGIKADMPRTFQNKYITDTDKLAILKATLPINDKGEMIVFDTALDLYKAQKMVDEKFSMYANDYGNKEAAIARQSAEQEKIKTEAAATIEQEAAINNLQAKAGMYTYEGGPQIKRKLEVIEENSDTWLVAVLTEFVGKYLEVKKYVGVKEVSKLTVKQMAAALGKYASETGEVLGSKLQMKEVEK